MKHKLVAALVGMTLTFAGCVSTGPVISKSSSGNLQIDVSYPPGAARPAADLHLDGVFIGNVSQTMPVIYAKRGERVVRVEAPGYRTYEKAITILGEPNHQLLVVEMKKDQDAGR